MFWLWFSLILNVAINIFGIIFLLFLLVPVIRGAPFVPTHKERITRALEMAGIKKGDKIVDLGSGDGRILIAAAQKGALSYGFDINPFLILRARQVAKSKGLENLVFCKCCNFWSQDLSDFDVVFVYGITYIMKGLKKKIYKELKKGAKVVAFVFPFPDWQPISQENGIYVYEL